MPTSGHFSPIAPAPLLKAARRLLRPLIRLMMRSGLTYPVLADALRRLFVEVAVNEILTDPKSRTDSRISILTGVHRKELKRLREMPADALDEPNIVTLASQIIARWVGAEPFIAPDGTPLKLRRVSQGADDAEPTFDALVAAVTSDIRPRAVLDDLLSHGVVSVDSDDRVQLNQSAFIPSPGGEEQLFYFARNLHDHLGAAVANIAAQASPPFLDRSVHYDRLTPEQARSLDEFARAAAMRVLLDVNRQALDLTAADTSTDGPRRRVNFGVYVYDEAEPPAVDG